MSEYPPLGIGDFVQVQLKWANKKGISVVSGTIVSEDERTFGFQQFKLDSGWWFSPQSDTIVSFIPKPNGSHERK